MNTNREELLFALASAKPADKMQEIHGRAIKFAAEVQRLVGRRRLRAA